MRSLSAALLRLVVLCSALPAPASAGPKAQREPSARPASSASQIRLAAVGDVVFGRYLSRGDVDSYSPVSRVGDPLAEIAPALRAADVAFANLETPLLPSPAPSAFDPPGVYVFRGDPERARQLRQAGLGVLSLANNHTTNLGLAGAVATRRHLLGEGIRAVGAGASREEALLPALVDCNGLRLGVLALTLWNGDHRGDDRGGALAHVRAAELLEHAAPLLRKLRESGGADWVVVSLHWGVEYAAHPDAEQRRLGRGLIDAGADLVLGHHPHVLQDVERYRGGLIAYSLGNFLFDNPQLVTRQTAVLRATLQGAGPLRQLREVSLVPVQIGGGDFVPRLATGAEHQVLAARLAELAPEVAVAPDPALPPSRAAPRDPMRSVARVASPGAERKVPPDARSASTLARAPGWVEPEW